MLKGKLYRRLLIASITGSLLISSGVVAFAATTKASDSTKPVITGKFADSAKKVGRGGFQKDGVTKSNPLVAVLKTQVTAGVITQAESDAITSYLTTKEAAEKVTRAAEKTRIDAMTDAEKKTYREANKPVRTDVLADLVKAKFLTQTQADKIKAAMPQGRIGVKPGPGMEQGKSLTNVLKTEVTAGLITQAEADKATAFIKAKADAKKAKEAAMTDAEKKAYHQANRPAKVSILSELVTAGILTQSQADKIEVAMPQKSEMGKERGKLPGEAAIK
ncbi:MAG: hypothetical protein H7Y18_08645 [Clostridiaceae bacterium]|nr:hypothetical protein [Clostridiaceae bacterium]